MRWISAIAARPAASASPRAAVASSVSPAAKARRAPLRCSMLTASEWAIKSWISRARWRRSSSFACSASSLLGLDELGGDAGLRAERQTAHPADREPEDPDEVPAPVLDGGRIEHAGHADRQDDRSEPSPGGRRHLADQHHEEERSEVDGDVVPGAKGPHPGDDHGRPRHEDRVAEACLLSHRGESEHVQEPGDGHGDEHGQTPVRRGELVPLKGQHDDHADGERADHQRQARRPPQHGARRVWHADDPVGLLHLGQPRRSLRRRHRAQGGGASDPRAETAWTARAR